MVAAFQTLLRNASDEARLIPNQSRNHHRTTSRRPTRCGHEKPFALNVRNGDGRIVYSSAIEDAQFRK